MSSKSYIEAWLDGRDGHHFYTRTYPATSPQKAVLVFVHGFADHISRYEDVHPRFAAHGITVFAYDMRGFGRTALDEAHRSAGELYGKTSRPLELGDLDWWVNHVANTYPDVPIFVMGHSAVSTVRSSRPSPRCRINLVLTRRRSRVAEWCLPLGRSPGRLPRRRRWRRCPG